MNMNSIRTLLRMAIENDDGIVFFLLQTKKNIFSVNELFSLKNNNLRLETKDLLALSCYFSKKKKITRMTSNITKFV